MISGLLLVVALIGLLSCTVFLGLVLAGVARYRRRRNQPAFTCNDTPAVTLLKPLCGLEPNLERSLASFFDQDYPDFEIIFGTRDDSDPALEIARAVSARYPQVPVKYVYSGEPDRPNAKVCSLMKMVPASTSEYLIISDSDVEVTPSYIREVVRPLLDPKVGGVTCLYRGVPTGGVWSRLEALGMSVEMTSGVVVADMLEGMKFALGPTMATRRAVLEEIGGMEILADYCSDDYILGNKIAAAGYTVVLSNYIVNHIVLNRTFRQSILHQVRWMKSTRFSRPKGHFGTGLTFAIPFGLVGLLLGFTRMGWVPALSLFGLAVLNRLVMAIAAGWGVVHDRRSLRDCWLYPLRDLMGFCFWAASYLGTEIVWRHERYRLLEDGVMARVSPASSDSASVTVDRLA